jgi:hypothetical protein
MPGEGTETASFHAAGRLKARSFAMLAPPDIFAPRDPLGGKANKKGAGYSLEEFPDAFLAQQVASASLCRRDGAWFEVPDLGCVFADRAIG